MWSNLVHLLDAAVVGLDPVKKNRQNRPQVKLLLSPLVLSETGRPDEFVKNGPKCSPCYFCADRYITLTVEESDQNFS
jgi:hypothetical protein